MKDRSYGVLIGDRKYTDNVNIQFTSNTIEFQ